MVFSSPLFIFYFLPIFLVAYLLTPFKYRNWTALLGSLVFYAWGAPFFVFVLLASSLADFIIAQKISVQTESRPRKNWLVLSLFLNLGLLAYFKYSNFFVENFNELLVSVGLDAIPWIDIALPIGISFFTFQKLSYVIDVYQFKTSPLKNFADLLLYICLFPQLIAGPIVRYNEIAVQIQNRTQNYKLNIQVNGLFRFALGLAKKLFIADVLGEMVDQGFQMEAVGNLATTEAWILLLAYAFQIYFDFSAYSDMAIGLGKLMGFDLPENFDFPYISQSITEFWRRWHITLSNWMRDYLYIPLGGNRKGTTRTFLNLWIVFILSGLWHGAAWNFILWGAFHGFFLFVERYFLLKPLKSIGKWLSLPFTFFIVLMSWVLFRAESLELTKQYYIGLFSWKNGIIDFSNQFWFAFIVAFSFSFIPAIGNLAKWLGAFYKLSTNHSIIVKSILTLILLTLCLSEVAVSGFHPFIYFRF